MIKNEWKNLLHNKIMFVVVIAIIAIPIIYAGLFLKSMWDPYGSVDHLPVAVVNEDKPVDYDGTTLSVGKDMVEELRENDSMAFNFVDSRTAEDGLENGTYYMVITIPEDFSANAATLMDDEPKKMELKYETNPGTNYIASKLSETALLKIKDAVATKVTETYTQTVFDQIAKVGDGMQDAADGSGELKDGIESAAKGNQTITQNLKKLSSSTLTFADGAETLTKGIQEYTDGVSQVNEGARQLDDGVSTLTSKVPELTSGIDTLNSGVKSYTDGAASLKSAGKKLTAAVPQISSGASQLSEGASTLNDGIKEYTDGVSTLASNNEALTSGTGQLADGAKTLASGADTLSNGTKTLASGTAKLVANNDSLTSGARKLADGASQIQSGSSQLYDGSKELGDGMTKLKDGSSTLSSSLSEGADQVKNTKSSDTTVSMFATPIEDEETQITTVENNGHAMAPYMMSVGLWVGALAFCLMYPLTTYKGKLKSGFAWWASKASILYPVAILQGLLLIILLHVFNGFTPIEMTKTVLFACLTAMAFTSIMYFFNITFGKVGSFLMLVFMVIQLAGSAGTYPVEISPEFVSKIHSYVPFTYTVNAFRSTIAGGTSIRQSVYVLIGLIVVFTLLTILQFNHMAHQRKANKETLYDWLEEKGLA